MRRPELKDARYRAYQTVVSHGWLADAYCALRPIARGNNVTAKTEMVIEGFPRCANTYAVAAFVRANPSVNLAHHLHSALNVERAARQGLPLVVLIRSPQDACASLMQREKISARTALVSYVSLHRRIAQLRDACVISDFPLTTQDFGRVISAVNDRFGTTFTPYERTPENEAWCRDFVRAADADDQGEVRAHTLSLPVAARAGRTAELRSQLRDEQLYAPATAIYTNLAAESVR